MKLTVQFDGGYSIHKGIGAGAAVLYDEAGEEIAVRAKFLRAVTTPIAEYTALIVGLGLAAEHAGAMLASTDVVALGDAELVVRQVNQIYQCKRRSLANLAEMSRMLAATFQSCDIRLFPKSGENQKRRNGNVRADAVARKCQRLEEDLGWTTP